MDDDSWDKTFNTIFLCTDYFSLEKLESLVKVLYFNFDLVTTINKRMNKNRDLYWRIRFSSKSDNIKKLRSLVSPYFVPSMNYKLGPLFKI